MRLSLGSVSLRTRLTLLLFLAGALPLITCTLVELRGARASHEAAGVRLLESCADALTRELDGFHRRHRLLSAWLANDPSLVRLLEGDASRAPQVEERLRGLDRSDPQLRGLAVFDLQGVIRHGTEPPLLGRSYAFRDYFRRARAGEANISPVYLAVPEVDSVPTIAYATPVRADARVVGVVAVYVRAHAFWAAVERGNESAGPGSFAVVQDQDTIRIAHSFAADELFHPARALDPDAVERLVAERRFGERTRALVSAPILALEEARRVEDRALAPVFRSVSPANQSLNLVATRHLQEVPWTVFFQLPEATLLAPANRLVRETLLVALLVLTLTLAVGASASAWVSRPLRGLIAAAERLSAGRPARVDVTGQGEVGALETSWNALVEALEAQRGEQERRVETRTRDLAEARAQLEARNVALTRQNADLELARARELTHTRTLSELAGEGSPRDGLDRALNALAEQLDLAIAVCWRLSGANLAPLAGPGAAGLARQPVAGAVAAALEHGRPVLLQPLPRDDLQLRVEAGLLTAPPRAVALLPLVGGDGAAQGLISVAALHDIPPADLALLEGLTQPFALALSRAHLAEESQRAHADLQRVIDSAPVGMVLVDEAGVIRLVNGYALELFGWERERLLGQPIERLVPARVEAEHPSLVQSYFQNPTRRAVGRGLQLTARRRDGTEFAAEVALVPLETAWGRCALAGVSDVSARVAAMRELDLFFSVATDLFTVVDGDGRFVRVNPAWERVLGYPLESLRGQRFMDLVHPPDREATTRAMDALLRGERVSGFENRYLARDGRLCWLRWAATPVLDLGLVFATARDVSEEHRAAELMQEHALELRAQSETLRTHQVALETKNRELEQASRFKSEFLANMSHELRTPLNAVIGFSELLLCDAEQPLSAVQRKRVEDVLGSGRHLLGLINDLLDLVKVEAGRMTLNLEPVAVGEAVADALSLIKPVADQKQITLGSSVSAARPVLADRARLRQILLNLLSNAVKFSPPGSQVELLAGEARGFVRFAVVDHGVGIDPTLRRRLFQPFVQGEGALVKTERGTGLGLAISRRLVEAHGGEIEVLATAGGGSTFAFTIPECTPDQTPLVRQTEPVQTAEALGTAPRPSARVPVTPGPRRRPGAPPLVLIVERDPQAVQLLESWLGQDHELVRADGIRAALELAERTPPDLVLLDVTLGEEDGLDLLVALKERPSLAAVPVIVTAAPEHGERALPLGAAEWLIKPIDRHALLARIHELIPSPPVVLVVDDDPRVEEVLRGVLEGEGYLVVGAACGLDGLERARATGPMRPGLIVIDLLLPDTTGLVLSEVLASDERTADIPRILLTAADLDPAERHRLRQHVLAVADKGDLTREAFLATLSRHLGARPAPPPPTGQILVVDDHDLNRALVRSILEAEGREVLEAEDGARALELARRARPALILMDLAMPHMDGFTALAQLRADPETRHLPVLALTALAMRSDERQAREAGFDGFLTKPIDRQVLLEAVRSFVPGAGGGAPRKGASRPPTPSGPISAR